MVCTHVTPADQLTAAEALRLPNVGERADEVARGGAERSLDASDRIEDHAAAGDVTRRRLLPPTGGLFAFPQGSLAPQARAGSDPRHGREECDKHSPSGAVFRHERGGRSQPRSL
ncbi:MAG: hypothetical protein F4Z65_09395 [Acidobacteria bacterium]|nr:hypothetical protein [Acidobacteriota bacterium]MYA46641.1 hypothetical protein [Acidobacteriota bacterium]